MNVRRLSALGGILCVVMASANALAQVRGQNPGVNDPFNGPNRPAAAPTYEFQGAILMLNVYGDSHSALDRQALVKLSNQKTAAVVWQATHDKSQAIFYDLPVGTYDIEVNAVGYLSSHQEMSVQAGLTTYHRDVVIKRDPASVELEVSKDPLMPPKARKRIGRAVSDLKSGNLKQAQKELAAAYKIVPANSDVNFLQGYVAFQQSDMQRAQDYLKRAVELDPRNVQALTLLGRLHLLHGDYGIARPILEQAVQADSGYWMAHNLLAETYLRLGEFGLAREQAQLAIEKGKGGGNIAQLVLGESLANLGDNQEAIHALRSFLQNFPAAPSSKLVHDLIAELEHRESNRGGDPKGPPANLVADSLAIADTGISMKTWQPPGVDDLKPQVASGVSCPREQVINGAGERVKQFMDDISRFAAIEEVLHEQLDELGNPLMKVRRSFNYVASISEDRPGIVTVDENRTERSGLEEFPEQIATRGLPTLALIFHPLIREDYEMICEGLGDWNGQPTWLVHFRQRDDRPRRIKAYKIGEHFYPIGLKGRAWITADTFQIARIESELVKSMPEIQLLSDHEMVDYGAVPFQKKNMTLWLPKNAELYFDFRRHHYFRRHSFDHFMLFAVDSEDKVIPQNSQPVGGDSQPDSPRKF